MSKRRLIDGIGCIGIAVIAFLMTLHPEVRTTARLSGLAGTYFVIGGMTVIRYFYDNSPGNRALYEEAREIEAIGRRDERNEKIRDKAGYYAYQFGLEMIVAAIIGSVMLEAFGVIEHSDAIAAVLGGFLILQILAERVIFRYLGKRY